MLDRVDSTIRKSNYEIPFANHLIDFVGLIFIVTLLLTAPNLAGDPGVGWHLMTGRWISEHRSVPHEDPFLWTRTGVPWVCNQWLADLIFWSLYTFGGLSALHLFCYCLPLCTHLFVFRNLLSTTKIGPVIGVISALLGITVASVQWIVRPVIFSYSFFAILISELYKLNLSGKPSNKDFVKCFVFFALWANLHPAFAIGLLVLGIRCLVGFFEGVERRLWLFLLSAGLAGSLINPFGIALLQNTIFLVSSKSFMQMVTEWRSPDFHDPALYPYLLFLAWLVIGKPQPEGERGWEKLTMAILVILSLRSARLIGFCGIMFFAPFAARLQIVSNHFLRPGLKAASVARGSNCVSRILLSPLIAILLLSACLTEFITFKFKAPEIWGDPVFKEIPAVFERGKIFHTPNIGGLITLLSYPQRVAWIDDRNEVCGEGLYKDFFSMQYLNEHFPEVSSKYGFEFYLLEKETPLAFYLRQPASGAHILVEGKEFLLFENNKST